MLHVSFCECIINAKKTLNVKSDSHAGVNDVACFVIFTVQLSKKFSAKGSRTLAQEQEQCRRKIKNEST